MVDGAVSGIAVISDLPDREKRAFSHKLPFNLMRANRHEMPSVTKRAI